MTETGQKLQKIKEYIESYYYWHTHTMNMQFMKYRSLKPLMEIGKGIRQIVLKLKEALRRCIRITVFVVVPCSRLNEISQITVCVNFYCRGLSFFRLRYLSTSTVQRLEISRVQSLEISTVEVER